MLIVETIITSGSSGIFVRYHFTLNGIYQGSLKLPYNDAIGYNKWGTYNEGSRKYKTASGFYSSGWEPEVDEYVKTFLQQHHVPQKLEIPQKAEIDETLRD
ncbi:MAG: hypothetical protein WCI51_02235 [Lentisphaerota bacterium]